MIETLLLYSWPKRRILEAYRLANSFSLTIGNVHPDFLLLSDRFYIYKDGPLEATQRALEHQEESRTTYVWGDGSGTTGDKPAGCGVVVEEPFNSERILIAESCGLGTNNHAELSAVWRGLKEVADVARPIIVRTDSQYTIGSLTKDWQPQKNVELIRKIRLDLSYRKAVRFEHVAGHAGVEQNEMCDRLARCGRLGLDWKEEIRVRLDYGRTPSSDAPQ